MKRKNSYTRFFLSFTLFVLLINGGFCLPRLNAQEPMEEVVYFIDGSIVRGFIVHINRKIIRIALMDGTIIERPVTLLYRFYSKRHFSEIYNQALEAENLKFEGNAVK